MPSESGVEHAQVHFVGDESGPAGARKRIHIAILDLQLSRLGALWIAVQSAGSECQCVIRAEDAGAREALAGAQGDLQDAIAAAGYTTVRIQTEPWDGDRLAAAAAALGHFSGFEAEA